MDVLANYSIFQELQLVHDTGYFSALPSLEENWQQSTSIPTHMLTPAGALSHSLRLSTDRSTASFSTESASDSSPLFCIQDEITGCTTKALRVAPHRYSPIHTVDSS
ncbi:hypothetical protein NFI96_026936 [Prochilodus magdalenae]|nr:hypothetical protein NFI96_026936 [Prochilodus magdalenae]